MQVLRHRGLGRVHSTSGLAPRAVRDLEVGVASGRFTIADPTVALLGVPSEDAQDVARRPLPDLDGTPRARTWHPRGITRTTNSGGR